MDNQNAKIQHYTPDMVGKKYYQLDTTTSSTKTAIVPALNGRQGDDMRAVNIAFTDDGEPHDLTNSKISLRVLDAAGVVKVADKIINMVDARGGLVVFGVPKEVYEYPGEVQRAYFVIEDQAIDGSKQVVSTVNVDFEILENGIDISDAKSTIYISSLDKLLTQTGKVVTTDKDNSMTGSNSFTQINVDNAAVSSAVVDSLSVGVIDNSSLTSLDAQLATVSNVALSGSTKADVDATSLDALTESVTANSSAIALNSQNIHNVSFSAYQTDSRLSDVATTIDDIRSTASNADGTASLAFQHANSLAASLGKVSNQVAENVVSNTSMSEVLSNTSSAYSIAVANRQALINVRKAVWQLPESNPDVTDLGNRINAAIGSLEWIE